MITLAESKAIALTNQVTADSRWRLEDELLCEVFGLTLYGYVFGVGRLVCALDVVEIRSLSIEQLTNLGIGPTYADELIEVAHNELLQEENTSLHSHLVGIGHSHFASEDLTELVESIFRNTQQIRDSLR